MGRAKAKNEIIVNGDYAFLVISRNGEEVIRTKIDAKHTEAVGAKSWYFTSRGKIQSTTNGKAIDLPRFIYKRKYPLKDNRNVKHKDGDKFNNTEENLFSSDGLPQTVTKRIIHQVINGKDQYQVRMQIGGETILSDVSDTLTQAIEARKELEKQQETFRKQQQKICEVDGCLKRAQSSHNGTWLCPRHYAQMLRFGKIQERTSHDKNEIIADGEYAYILLYDKNNKVKAKTKIDAKNIDLVKDMKWVITNYGVKNWSNRYLSRVICERNGLVDKNIRTQIKHIDGDILNNTEENFFIVPSRTIVLPFTNEKPKNKIAVEGEYAYITLSKNKKAKIDAKNVDIVKGLKWGIDRGKVVTHYQGGVFFLHRIICEYNGSLSSRDRRYVEHIDGDKFNNTEENLRIIEPAIKPAKKVLRQVVRPPSNNTSGKVGVCWLKNTEKWYASIKVNKKKINLGYYEKFEDAVAAREAAEEKYFGKFKPNN